LNRIHECTENICIIIVAIANVADIREWLGFFGCEKEKLIESVNSSESQKEGCAMEGRIWSSWSRKLEGI